MGPTRPTCLDHDEGQPHKPYSPVAVEDSVVPAALVGDAVIV